MSEASRKVVIAGYVRSPFTLAHKGELKDVRPDELLAQTLKGLVDKTGVKPELIEDVKVGCAFPEGEQGLNIGRIASLMAGLPKTTAGVTTNRFCGSSMQAIHDAAGMIALGAADAVIAAGVESMSRIPMGGFNISPNPKFAEQMPEVYMGMGETAENLAKKYEITRKEQDEFSLRSHFKAAAARKAGRFAEEIVPIRKKDGTMVKDDGCIREDSTMESMAGLKTSFLLKEAGGTVTAGNSSPLTDGAAAILITSEEFALKHGLKIMAEITSIAVAGCDPETMGLGPVFATDKALKRAGLESKDLQYVEGNEAFAAQIMACLKEMQFDESKLNRDGGATALGHPLGASGARITGKAAMVGQEEGYDVVASTMCIGGGQGITTIMKPYKKNAGPKAA